MIRVLICDDHPVVRSGLRAVFSSAPDIEVVGEAERGQDAITTVRVGGIDLVTMDLRFPDGLSGVESIRRLQAVPSPVEVLVLTNYDDDADIVAAIEAGARGYLLKDSPPRDLIAGARSAAAGRPVLAPVVQERLMTTMRAPRIELTPREADVLHALDRGLSNKEMSEELYLSPATVKTHLARLYAKLGVSSRTAALAKARESGLLRPA